MMSNSPHKEAKMYYQNTKPQGGEFIYQNTTPQAQNLIITMSGGDGALSKSTWIENNWTKYWSAGARGVDVQAYIDNVLIEVAKGGIGNPQSIADQKVWVRNERYQCGRYWYGKKKYCNRDVYDWTYKNRAFPRGGSGDTRSLAINLKSNSVLKITFVGSDKIINTLFNGSVSITLLPSISQNKPI